MTDSDQLTPRAIVARLDQHIIGQHDAKRAVALAFRNRWRRLRVEDKAMRAEITPKNILMVGPTGCGKTEIARRLAKLADAPFIKVEATKFTEVGYVGRDVESIIRDLADVAVKLASDEIERELSDEAEKVARDKVIDALKPVDDSERTTYGLRLDGGELDDKPIDVQYKPTEQKVIKVHGPVDSLPHLDMQAIGKVIQDQMKNMNKEDKPKWREMKVADAFKHFRQEEINKKVSEDQLTERAVTMVEQRGMVFIDEIDKIASTSERNIDVSRQGVQRDLLPLVEGTAVQTKIGIINTDHILFVASGSFHYSKPSDLIPELQGRLPVRVNLKPLTVTDFEHILTKTDFCLSRQYEALLAAEDVKLSFTPDAIKTVAQIAHDVNERQENIGARRLHTLMEKLVEKVSFTADDPEVASHEFDAASVTAALEEISKDEEASRIFL